MYILEKVNGLEYRENHNESSVYYLGLISNSLLYYFF
ncbi:unnamed protein product [Brassica napus]|uniref:(rape) hypothetical protein n=1 Tax=Brassica napus TaxID=3708 RepID=A0A816YQT6_BRANA|nr:unnamed protein product [Brassica napus]